MKLGLALLLLLRGRLVASTTLQRLFPSVFNSSSISGTRLGTSNDIDINSGAPESRLGGSKDLSKRRLSFQFAKYSLRLEGQSEDNWEPFVEVGDLVLTDGIPSPGTRNGENAVEVVIRIGDPRGQRGAGSMHYATNRYLYPYLDGPLDDSFLDFAFVSATSDEIDIRPDPTLAETNLLSLFNARSKLTTASVYYYPANGGFKLSLESDGTISGNVSMTGMAIPGGEFAPYCASISGNLVERGTTML